MKLHLLLKRDLRNIVHRIERTDSFERTLFIFILLYIAYFTLASFLRYDNFYTGRYDLGNMAQAVWNTTQGRLLEMTNENTFGTVSRLAYHADFFLVFLAPFYAFWPNPKLLLLVQTVVIALGSIFVYKLSLLILRRRLVSLAFASSYLLYPALQRSNLYDFHAVVLATTFLLGAFYFMRVRRYFWFLIFAFLAGSTKEQVWAVLALFGIFIVGRALYSLRVAPSHVRHILKKELRFGIAITGISLLVFYALLWQVIPYFHGKEHFATEYFSDFGSGPGGIIRGILSSPGDVLATVTEESRRMYLKQLLLPIGYLSVFSPLYLIFALPDLTINLLSNNDNLHQIYYQYTATITPFLYIAAIYGVRLIRYFIPKLHLSFFALFVIAMALYGAYLFGPLPYSLGENLAMFTKPRQNRDAIQAFINTLPPDAKVTASNQLGAQLSHRRYVYTLPVGIDQAHYVLFLLNDATTNPSGQVHRDMADRMRNNPNFILVYEDGTFLAFKKNKLAFVY